MYVYFSKIIYVYFSDNFDIQVYTYTMIFTDPLCLYWEKIVNKCYVYCVYIRLPIALGMYTIYNILFISCLLKIKIFRYIYMSELHYYAFRYTLDPEINVAHYFNATEHIFLDKMNAEYFTIGYETMNKYGELTNPHIHIHFATYDNMASIRARFVRYWKKNDESRSGNALYSLSAYKGKTEIQDYNRFFAYPLKQNGKQFDKIMTKLPPDFDLDKMRELAYAEWCRNIDHNKKQRERAESKESTYDKIESELDDKEVSSIEDIQDVIIEFYKVNKLSANFKTMMGYVNTYRLRKGYMSKEEARKLMNKYI